MGSENTGKQIIADLKRAQSAAWILPALCISISFLVSNKALSLASATSTAFLRSMTTLMTPLLGWLLYRKGLEKRHILIYALVMLGMYLLCGRGGLSGFGLGEKLTLSGAVGAFLILACVAAEIMAGE